VTVHIALQAIRRLLMDGQKAVCCNCSGPKSCTLLCVTFCCGAGECSGFKQWQLLSIGNSVSCDLSFVTSFWNGGRTFVKNYDKRGVCGGGGQLLQNPGTLFMDDPTYTRGITPLDERSAHPDTRT